jgi:phosphoribosylformimino-5-aminoimidazole carboxamide ribotide isomerase
MKNEVIIFPAIDLAGGNCVRLLQGRREDETIYDNDPVHIARQWEEQGASWLHLVDLDGAFDGKSKNGPAIQSIVSSIKIPVQLGGGIRSLKSIETLLKKGCARVILGTVVVENPGMVRESILSFGADKIVVGIDARDGMVAVRGWTEQIKTTALDMGKRMTDMGVKIFVYTDISRDGMLSGPNLSALRTFADSMNGQVIASGGISSLDDVSAISNLREHGITGMITGKALYEKKFSLREALALVR